MNELIAQLRNLMGADSSDDQLRSKIEQIQNQADHGSPLYFVCEAALMLGHPPSIVGQAVSQLYFVCEAALMLGRNRDEEIKILGHLE